MDDNPTNYSNYHQQKPEWNWTNINQLNANYAAPPCRIVVSLSLMSLLGTSPTGPLGQLRLQCRWCHLIQIGEVIQWSFCGENQVENAAKKHVVKILTNLNRFQIYIVVEIFMEKCWKWILKSSESSNPGLGVWILWVITARLSRFIP